MAMPAPECTNAAAAYEVLCGSRAGYEALPSPPARLSRTANVSLPPVGLTFAKGEDLLRGEDLEVWVSWQREILRSPSELQAALADAESIKPHTDPMFTRYPLQYAKLICKLYERNLVKIGRRRRATVGLSFVKKKTEICDS